MTINEKIKLSLSTLDIPSYFITRGENKAPCIVFNYNESPKSFADDEESITSYTVLLNLYTLSQIEKNKKDVLDIMRINGFIRTSIQSTLLDDTGYFNTPMLFKIDLRESEIING